MIKLFFILLFILASSFCFSQQDTTKVLDSVTLKAFEQKTAISSAVLYSSVLPAFAYNSKTSILNGLNSVAGVRMEERSPGSYRISIRGSSLRSPFGVRNIKVYWNNIPITDPGGNTYFNQFASNNFSSVEVFKGPVGSMYGAGSGGLIILTSNEISPYSSAWKPNLRLEYIHGSYGLNNIFLSGEFGTNKSLNQISFAHNQIDGYRDQTNMRRDNFTWSAKYTWDRLTLTSSLLFTDMYYQTPGALTLSEFKANPKQARPAGGGFPSAINAKAGIYQKNLLAGLTQKALLGSGFENTTSLYLAYAQIKNPAIRNYEKRSEPSFGGRTWFKYKRRIELITGGEFQQGYFSTQVFKNKNGNRDTLQTNDEINIRTYTIYSQAGISVNGGWYFGAGISLSGSSLDISRLNINPIVKQSREYKNELCPVFNIGYNFPNSPLYWSVRLSRGFSPPTTLEVLPSTGIISTDLQAEHGYNYETSLKQKILKGKMTLKLTGFYFKLNDALVQRRDISGADFFVNAGDTKQKGLEFTADYRHEYFPGKLIDNLGIRTDLTLNDFKYGHFIKGADDFSGKRIPSVPTSALSMLVDAELMKNYYLQINYYGASSIFLNDANSFEASPYHLLGGQIGFQKKKYKRYNLKVFIGADNLLNEVYSLGNDINAAANRFYNAAPRRNYYAGISFKWIKKEEKK